MKLHTFVGLILLVSVNLTFSKPLSSTNQLMIKEIPLNQVNKTFKKQFAKRLNKNTCEKRIFIKSAQLKLKNGQLLVDFTARITRRYCTRRAKQKVYEKTKSIHYSYAIETQNGNIVLLETSNNLKQKKIEKALTDLIGKNSKKAVAEVVKDILGLNNGANPQLHYQSIELGTDKITVKSLVEE